MTISHCFRKLAKSNNGVIYYVAWLGPHPIGALVRPLGKHPAIRETIQSRAMPLRSRQGSTQLDGPQASKRYMMEALHSTVHV